MTYEQAIDVKAILSWLQGEHGAQKEIAKELEVHPNHVSAVLHGRCRNNSIVECAMKKIIERQTRMIKFMITINQNSRQLKELIEPANHTTL